MTLKIVLQELEKKRRRREKKERKKTLRISKNTASSMQFLFYPPQARAGTKAPTTSLFSSYRK
jgi:hypothetical protein